MNSGVDNKGRNSHGTGCRHLGRPHHRCLRCPWGLSWGTLFCTCQPRTCSQWYHLVQDVGIVDWNTGTRSYAGRGCVQASNGASTTRDSLPSVDVCPLLPSDPEVPAGPLTSPCRLGARPPQGPREVGRPEVDEADLYRTRPKSPTDGAPPLEAQPAESPAHSALRVRLSLGTYLAIFLVGLMCHADSRATLTQSCAGSSI